MTSARLWWTGAAIYLTAAIVHFTLGWRSTVVALLYVAIGLLILSRLADRQETRP